MLDQLMREAGDGTLEVRSPQQRNVHEPQGPPPHLEAHHLRFARLVSLLLSPACVSVPFVLLVAFYHATSPLLALSFALLTLLFVSAGPLLYVVISVRAGLLTDMDVSRRAERWHPFLISVVSSASGLLLLSLLRGPRTLELVLATTLVSGVIFLVVTLWWKISVHAATLAGAATMLTGLYGVVCLPSFLLLLLVCWSRVVLGRHTPAQVVLGSLVSSALAVGALVLLGL
jgi:membrane-associated phospholipid phosphatase